jgi:hypothetical protein
MSLETLQGCHSDWVSEHPGLYGVWQVYSKGVETSHELACMLEGDSVKICWVLMKMKLRVVVLVKDLRGEGLICRCRVVMGVVESG